MDLEKLITTNPIWDFFTETFHLLSARPFKNLVQQGVYGFHHKIIGFDSLGTPSPPGGSLSVCPHEDIL